MGTPSTPINDRTAFGAYSRGTEGKLAYLIDVWDITERAVPQGCYAPATLVLIKMLCSARYTFAFYPIPA